jgi:hypothetical protein
MISSAAILILSAADGRALDPRGQGVGRHSFACGGWQKLLHQSRMRAFHSDGDLFLGRSAFHFRAAAAASSRCRAASLLATGHFFGSVNEH